MNQTSLFTLTATLLLAVLPATAQPAPPRAERPARTPATPPGARVLRDLEYVPGGHERQKLDLYLPEKGGDPLPLIVWIHGGAWRAGSKDNCPAARFVSRGYAVASVNYRLSQHATFPAQIQDCKAAIRWLRAHAQDYHLDPHRFGAWGSSAGGHLVALLATTGGIAEFDQGPHTNVSSRVQAVVDFFGPTDLLLMAAQSGPNSRMNHDAPDSPESLLIGGAVQEHKEKARRASPINYVTPDDAPILLVHGDADPLVPHQQSILLHDALKKAGVEASLHLVKGGGHGNGFGPEVQQRVRDFFDQHLRPARAAAAAP